MNDFMNDFVHKFPQGNLHEQNLDWIISEVKKLMHIIDDFTALQSIKWAGKWDISKAYSAWSIVSDGPDGYISIKPVPRGVEITNADYWAKIANYDALYAEFEQRIETLENAIEDLNNVTIPEIERDIENIDNDIENIDNDILNLNTRIDNINDRYFLFVGDSYGNTDDSHFGGWIKGVATKLGLTLNNNYWFTFEGGYSWGGSDNFYTLLSNLVTTLTDDEKNKITDVIMQGSVNDYQQTSANVKNGLALVENYIKNNLPNAKLTILCIGYGYVDASMQRGTINSYNALLEGATIASVYSDVWKVLKVGNWLQSDHVHPNQNGVNHIVEIARNIIMNGVFDFRFSGRLSVNFVGDGNYSVNIYGDLTKNGYHIYQHNPSNSEMFIFDSAKTMGNSFELIATHSGDNNIFMNECEWTGQALLMNTALTVGTMTTGVYKVMRVGSDYRLFFCNKTGSVSDVKRFYPYFDVCVDELYN